MEWRGRGEEVERYSLDSSVVVKWFSEEDDSEKALEMRDAFVRGDVELIVTPLLLCEVSNALRYKPDFDSEKLKEAIDALMDLQMEVEVIDKDLLKRSAEIAFDTGVTIYDAVPVAAAERRGALCVTADERTQYARMRGKYPVVLLKDFG